MSQVQILGSIPNVSDVTMETFADALAYAVTNIGGKLTPYVDVEDIRGTSMTIDKIGGLELRQLNESGAEVEESAPPLERRKYTWDVYANAIPVYDDQIAELIEDPSGKFVTKLMEAYNRKLDSLILKAVEMSVLTGKNGDVVLTAAQDGVKTVDASAAFTYEKLLELQENAINNGTSDMEWIFTLTGKENTGLMNEANYLAGSGNSLAGNFGSMIEVNGTKISKAGGFKGIHYAAADLNGTNRLIREDASYRYNIAMCPDAVRLGVGLAPKLEFARPSNKHLTTLIKFSCGVGYVREEGLKCQILKTTK